MSWLIKSMYGNYEVQTGTSIQELVELCGQPNTITFVDENVLKHWDMFDTPNVIPVYANENTKTLEGVGELINKFVESGATPKTKIIAIGGGIVQDAVGFIASIWCRGVDYILVPTTLLSQIDSCVGGKTSINHIRKNILGTFWPPKQILICPDFLTTLSDTDYWSGWGEWIKYNILQNKIDHTIQTLSSSIKGSEMQFIVDGLGYKVEIIQRDEFDKGERKFLNFGHTFGHALESVSQWKIPHGYAVFIGSLIAMYVSYKLGEENEQRWEELQRFSAFGRSYIDRGCLEKSMGSFEREWFTRELIEIAKKSDKKQEGGQGLRMVLVNKDGAYLHNIENENVLEQAIEWVYNEVCK